MRRLFLSSLAAVTAAIGTAVTPAQPARAEETFIVCSNTGHAAIASPVTSCLFAENVRAVWLDQGGPADVEVVSPVTGMMYDMHCSDGYLAHLNSGMTVPSVRCVGGNDAVVIIF